MKLNISEIVTEIQASIGRPLSVEERKAIEFIIVSRAAQKVIDAKLGV